MSKQSWHTVKVPSQIHDRIKKVLPWLGIPSVAEYARRCIEDRLRRDELFVEGQEELKEAAKHEI